jgi:outer membrane protein OmpA-like peptidoglycan-associated protein
MIFARGNTGKPRGAKDVELYISRYRDGGWSEPELMEISDADSWDSCPAFSKDGNVLYFASNRKGGYGGIDLYKATQDKNGIWVNVANLGVTINTPGDEMFPYMSDDGKLYFASNGQAGLGGLDIFVSSKKGKETKVENLGKPINSSYDDFGICFKNAVDGYFTSNREGGKGDDDIYQFFDVTPNTKIVNYALAITTKSVENNQESILTDVKLKVIDSKGKVLKEIVTGADGKLTIPVEPGRNYSLVGEKKDYFTKRENYSTVGKAIPIEDLVKPITDTTFQTTLLLEKIVVNKIVVLNNIYYDLDKADIRKDAAEELDNLVKLLQDNPTLKIELSSHTDVRGSDDYNLKLSQRRAESAVNYIISKGIATERLIAKGYGETKLIIKDAQTEEEHQVNRRTEFKVLEK